MSDSERFEIWQAQPEASLALTIGVGWLLCSMLQRANLIDQIPIWATFGGAIAGAGMMLYLSLRIFRKRTADLRRRPLAALALFPIFGIFLGTHVARTMWEAAAFSGVDARLETLRANVVSIDSKWRDKATVMVGTGSRQFEVRVSEELFAKLEPWRAPGRDCLLLPIESGRFGSRRVLLPNYLDRSWGPEHYAICNS